jgi:mono/diheme cytochrome c family protein
VASGARRINRIVRRRGGAYLFVGIGVSALVGLLVVAPLLVMHRADVPFERAYGNAVVMTVARLLAGDAKNPVAGNQRVITAGRYAYTGSCATCHGATGDGKGLFGQDTYPQATDLLSDDAKAASDAQLFWITKNGLSFTGMPAFGRQYKDDDIWALVEYIRALQQGRASAITVPLPTEAELAVADPHGNAVARGAAVYFAQGCQLCHGAVGNAPAELALRSRETEAVRGGRSGMPAYGTDRISNAELADLVAYLGTFSGGGRGRD